MNDIQAAAYTNILLSFCKFDCYSHVCVVCEFAVLNLIDLKSQSGVEAHPVINF